MLNGLPSLVLARPEALLIAIAALPVAFLYFLRMRFRRKAVGSTYIWRELAGATSGGDALKRRSVLLLLLQLAAIGLTALAAAGPSLVSRSVLRPGTLFLIDVSASMASRDCPASPNGLATGPNGPATSRVDAAVAAAIREIGALPPDAPLMAFACASTARPVLPDYSLDRGRVVAALRTLKAGGEGFSEATCADAIAAWLARGDTAWQACLIGDGGLDLEGRRLSSLFGGAFRAITIGTRGSSVGVTGLRLERREDGGTRASFTLWNGWPAEKAASLRISREKDELASAIVKAQPGWTRAGIDLAGAPEDGAYTISLARDPSDVPSAPGEEYRLAVNAQRALSVLLVGKSDPFLKAALAFGGISCVSSADFPRSISGADMVIVESTSAQPERIPAGASCNLLVLGGDPPPDAPLSARGMVSGAIVSTEPAHPLSRFLDWEGARAEMARVYAPRGDATVLATAGGAPILVAWEKGGYRSLAFGMDLARSDVGLKSAFPVLLENFFQWCVPRADDESAFTLVAGESVRRALPDSFGLRGGGAMDLVRTGPNVVLTPRETGFFEWEASSPRLTRGYIAANVPAAEIDVAPRELPAFHEAAASAGTSTALGSTVRERGRPLGPWLLALLAACLAGEWLMWRGGFARRDALRGKVKA